ncbi:FtsK/SpoIIIE domain-containing protein [Streptomyces sp. P1-3]|uniref:FHA domain-containing protein n=1 Tax=Streptomyces sp. P1-3 TaxID=3421658 RepID=UPI003D36E832
MQIRLTVLGPRSAHPGPHSGPVPRPRSGPGRQDRPGTPGCAVDVLVTAPAGTPLASVTGGLTAAAAAAGADVGGGPAVLYAGPDRLDPQRCALGEPPLVDGAVLSLNAPADPDAHPGDPAAAAVGAPARLDVVAGPDAGGVHLLHGGQIRIGRSGEADVTLDDPDVSRLHCAVTVAEDGGVSLADLGSTNGTSVNGERVGGTPIPLAPGALLRIGESALRLRVPAAEAVRGGLATAPDGEGHLRVGPYAGGPGAPGAGGAYEGPHGDGYGPASTYAAGTGPGAGPAYAQGTGPGRAPYASGHPGTQHGGGDPARAGSTGSAEDGRGTPLRGTPVPPDIAAAADGYYAAAGYGATTSGHGTGQPAYGTGRGGYGAGAGAGYGGGQAGHGHETAASQSGHSGHPGHPEGAHQTDPTDRSPASPRRRGIGAWARRLAGGRATDRRAGTADGWLADDTDAVRARAAAEAAALHQRSPDLADVLMTVLGPGPRLWERGPGHPDTLTVRLGVADRRTADGLTVPAAPVTVDLRQDGSLGLAGPRTRLSGLARSVIAQLAALHSPASLEIVLISTDRSRDVRERLAEWSWLGWLPQVHPAHGQDCRLLLAYDREQAAARTAELVRRLDDSRLGPAWVTAPPAAVAAAAGDHGGPYTLVVVDGDPGSPALRDTLARLAAGGAGAGVHVICLAETPAVESPTPFPAAYEAACAASPVFAECGVVALLSGDVATGLHVARPDRAHRPPHAPEQGGTGSAGSGGHTDAHGPRLGTGASAGMSAGMSPSTSAAENGRTRAGSDTGGADRAGYERQADGASPRGMEASADPALRTPHGGAPDDSPGAPRPTASAADGTSHPGTAQPTGQIPRNAPGPRVADTGMNTVYGQPGTAQSADQNPRHTHDPRAADADLNTAYDHPGGALGAPAAPSRPGAPGPDQTGRGAPAAPRTPHGGSGTAGAHPPYDASPGGYAGTPPSQPRTIAPGAHGAGRATVPADHARTGSHANGTIAPSPSDTPAGPHVAAYEQRGGAPATPAATAHSHPHPHHGAYGAPAGPPRPRTGAPDAGHAPTPTGQSPRPGDAPGAGAHPPYGSPSGANTADAYGQSTGAPGAPAGPAHPRPRASGDTGGGDGTRSRAHSPYDQYDPYDTASGSGEPGAGRATVPTSRDPRVGGASGGTATGSAQPYAATPTEPGGPRGGGPQVGGMTTSGTGTVNFTGAAGGSPRPRGSAYGDHADATYGAPPALGVPLGAPPGGRAGGEVWGKARREYPVPVAGGTAVTVDAVSPAWAERFARALAPLRPSGLSPAGGGAGRSAAALPDSARLLDELGLARATPASLLARWAAAADEVPAGGRTLAVLGAGADGPIAVDLAADGPHLLINGAPGTGKTELLRSVAASLAAAERPDRLGLVMVDGGGTERGAGLRVCTDLPHVSTYLAASDPLRMREFAQALSSELKRRAELLGQLDFVAWHARQGSESRMVAPRQPGDVRSAPAPAPTPEATAGGGSDGDRDPVHGQAQAHRQATGHAQGRATGTGTAPTATTATAAGTGNAPSGAARRGDVDSAAGGTLKLRTQEPGGGEAAARLTARTALPRLVVLVDDFDALVAPALGSPGRPAAGSVVRALEAIARDGARLGVHLIAASGRPDRTADTAAMERAGLWITLEPTTRPTAADATTGASGTGGPASPASPGPGEPAPGRGRLRRPDDHAVVPFQAGRVTGRIPRTATQRPTVVPLDWERQGDPPTRRPLRELGNGPTDLALLASALQRAAQSADAPTIPALV